MRGLLFLVIPIFSLIVNGCITPAVQETQQPKTQPETAPRYAIARVLNKEYQISLEGKQRKIIGGLNEEQPISIGELIYQECVIFVDTHYKRIDYNYTISYIYMGLDDKNNIKITYKWEYNPPKVFFHPMIRGGMTPDELTPKREEDHFLFPLNSKKQTILKVKSYQKVSPMEVTMISKKELIVAVVDEFSRITVEERGK